MDEDVINKAITQALEELDEKGIKGKESTPFLLARVAELTGGDSLASNIRLVFNNARIAALTAVELQRWAEPGYYSVYANLSRKL